MIARKSYTQRGGARSCARLLAATRRCVHSQEFSDDEHLGSRFNHLLQEEAILNEAQTVGIKRVIAYQLAQAMKRHKMSKSARALRMKTSRATLDRPLDPGTSSVTLQTLERGTNALGKTPVIELA